MSKLKIGASGNEYFFSENEDLVQYLRGRYPQMTFNVSLTLSEWPNLRNLHQLEILCPIREGMTYESQEVQNSLVDGLINFLNSVENSMYHSSMKHATVQLSRIETGSHTNATSLKTQIFGHLRAVFIQE